MFERIIITSLLAAIAVATTTLTTSHCPSPFSPSSLNASLFKDNAQLATTIYGSLFDAQTKAQIELSLNTGNLTGLQNQVYTTSFLQPYILAAALFMFVFLMVICCCTFDRRCPPCESWRRNYIKDPYSTCQLRITAIVTVVFAVGALIAAIVGLSSFGSLSSDLQMVSCSMYYSLDTATNGDQAQSWGGFAQIQAQVGNTSALLASAAATINSTLLGNEWIVTGIQSLDDMNQALWNNNKDARVLSPNPTTTEAAMNAGTALPTIVPLFIQQSLGPNTTSGSMVNDIDAGLQVTKKLSAQAYATYVAAINLANSAQNITSNTESNMQGISTATTYLASILESVNAFDSGFTSLAASKGVIIAEAVLGVVVLASLLALLGVLSTHLFGLLTCRRFVHFGWVCLGFSYFAVLAVLVVFLAVGGLSYNFCQYLGAAIQTKAGLVSFTSSSAGTFNKFFNYLDVCFFDDGNILKKFHLADEMKTVAEAFTDAQTYLDMQTAGNSLYVDATYAPAKIIAWVNQMNSLGLGTIPDSLSSDLTQDNPTVALANLNLRTLGGGSVNTTCSSDYWVFDSANCTNTGSEVTYTPSVDTTNGLYFPPTGSLCISLNSRISQSAPSIWTASDIANRYLSVRQCKTNSSQAYTQIVRYANSLTNYRDSRINLYKSLSDQLTSLLSTANTYNTNLTSFTAQVNGFFSAVAGLNNIVTNQLNGLTISANCSAIASSLRFFHNMYCVNFLGRTVKVVIACSFLLVLIFASVVAGAFLGVRYSRVEKHRIFAGESESEIFKQDLEESASSGSSHSSP